MHLIKGIPESRIDTKLYALDPTFFQQDWINEHRRWSCYKYYGVQCIVPGCNRTGSHIIHWYTDCDFKKYGDSGLGEHIDLIGYDPNGSPFLMTVDHIVPNKFGGPKVWWNLQPMCMEHNFNQKANMHHTPSRERLDLIVEKSGMIMPECYSVVPPTDSQLLELLVGWYSKRVVKKSKIV